MYGLESLNTYNTGLILRSAEAKYTLVERVIAGESQHYVAQQAGIDSSSLSKWVKRYKVDGYDGLKSRTRKVPDTPMNNKPLNDDERTELIELRAKTRYLTAENEAIKKLIALRREKEELRHKAKRQK